MSSAIRISLPLKFHQELFQEIRAEDKLVVMARGLGLLRVVTNLLHSYDAAGDNLVLLVGATPSEIDLIGEGLAEQAALSKARSTRGLSVINTDAMSISAREKLYARGGILAITSRILVVDLLRDGLPPSSITGVVVLHADRVTVTSLEAFILRIYRQKNKTGFLKAFSDNPEPFTTGFSPLPTMLKNLTLQSPSIWPRFHISVQDSLHEKKADVVEFSVAMTDSMVAIQSAIIECIETSVSEIRRMNGKELELEDWSVQTALHTSFDVIIRRQLDPIWHRVSWKTKQIVGDLKTLRRLLKYLVLYDCVSFYQYLEYIQTMQTPVPVLTRQNQSPWLFLDAAQSLFIAARSRVYTGRMNLSATTNGIPNELTPVLEEQPKWEMLASILEEIEREIYFNPLPEDDSHGTVLIMCEDDEEGILVQQLRQYLEYQGITANRDHNDDTPERTAAELMMRRQLRKHLQWKRQLPQMRALLHDENWSLGGLRDSQRQDFIGRRTPGHHTKRRRTRGGNQAAEGSGHENSAQARNPEDDPRAVAAAISELTVTENENQIPEDVTLDTFNAVQEEYKLYEHQNLVLVHPFRGDMDDRLLEETRPRYVIMYNPDPSFIRRVEIYKGSHSNRQVKIYFLAYKDSVEEQLFLSAVRKEKDSFSKLIRERGTMTVTLTTNTTGLENPQEEFLRTISTRIAGGGRIAATSEPPKVVVDAREFRSASALPSLLHARNITVIPCTLTVGDYIITPDICIERKTIPDLIESLRSGRLYSQCESMFQYYKTPILLIEFHENKAFTLEPLGDTIQGLGQYDLQSKLVLLTLAFPQLKIIWSSTPYQTAEIIEELKKNHPEPDPVVVGRYGLADGEDALTSLNRHAQDLLRAIPGVTEKNAPYLMEIADSVAELSTLSQKEICDAIGPEPGRKVYRFFNKSIVR
ncbi:DNA repair protein [Ascodesmis nigricans]|uniref:DNA repair protein n=1 Tax=Ascodesmis nigricans TaxID=341454 RepID=A0A4S2MZX5_9PEZI|nr:DNA repair protein [Ascodesmis nigricans]